MASEGKPSSLAALRAWLRLVRIEHAVLSAFGVLVSMLIASRIPRAVLDEVILTQPLPAPPIVMAALLVPILINIGAFALNDYWDIEADRLNKRKERPLVSGALHPRVALATAILGLALGALAGFFINFEAGIIALLFSILSIAYDLRLKDWPLAGNLFVAFSMAIAFLFGFVAAGTDIMHIGMAVWVLCAGAASAGFGRELVKTVQDMKGDREARGSKSLPHVIGARNSMLLAALSFALYCAAIPVIFLSSSFLSWNIVSSGLLALSFVAFAFMSCQLAHSGSGPDTLERVRKASLYALASAMLALLLAAI